MRGPFCVIGGLGVYNYSRSSEKEEERKKELHRMRDQERSRRMAELDASLSPSLMLTYVADRRHSFQRSTFDLLAAQDKIGHFEAQLRERNSIALYPQHLGLYFKHKYGGKKG